MDWQQTLQNKIYFDDVIGVPGTTWPIGTPGVPSDVIADIITMCAARNLRTISVHGALTLGAIMEHYNFVGYEHEDIADILSLGGQDVDGSHMEGLAVTGAQGGTGLLTLIRCVVSALTLFQGQMNRCSFYAGAFSFRDIGYIDLIDCESIYGDVTITVQAPTRASIKNWRGNLILTAQDGGVCYVRGFKGYLEIDAMTAGTLGVYANGADIQINADCTGGTINIYGNATVTGAGGGVAINIYTLEGRVKGQDDIHDDLVAAAALVTYTEDSVSGVTVAAWADALDVDTRGMKSMTIVLHNTHGAASLNWRLRARYADYAAGADEEIIEAPGEETLTFGTKGVATLLRGYSRIKVQVQDTVPATASAYTINYLINR